jgi:hypothetical protein
MREQAITRPGRQIEAQARTRVEGQVVAKGTLEEFEMAISTGISDAGAR